MITIDPNLSGRGIFAKRMQDFLGVLGKEEGIRLPGQRRFKQRALGFGNGVNVVDQVVEEIQAGIRQS